MDKKVPLVFSLFDDSHFVDAFAKTKMFEKGQLLRRTFPDGETYLRYDTPLEGREIIFIDTLAHPDDKILPLVFAAETAKDLGATTVGLIAPYLAYMRQDARFQPGEAITSIAFAKLLSQTFDWLVTVDPHLHRHHTLDEIYTIPTQVISAAPLITSWIRDNIENPLLIGPDAESIQWVSQIAKPLNSPFTVLEKIRLGDYNVKVSIPALKDFLTHTPVLVDDIISTGQTMMAALSHLKSLKAKPPVCIGVHPVFAGITTRSLIESGASRVVSCNTISHDSNQLDVSDRLIQATGGYTKPGAGR